MRANSASKELPAPSWIEGEPVVLQMHDRLPIGCLAFAIPDRSCEPLLRRGEIAIIDPFGDRAPVAGALYLRWSVSPAWGGSLRIVENHERMGHVADEDGEIVSRRLSYFVAHNRPRAIEQWAVWSKEYGMIPMADGPWDFARENSRTEFDRLIGRVVGVLAGDIVASEPGETTARIPDCAHFNLEPL